VVGVVSADTGLMVPDFRASERTFQLAAQVAGRAGRAGNAGRVVVQTRQPKHPALVFAAAHDYEGFAKGELAERRRYGWPPYTRLVRAVVSAKGEDAARRRCGEIAEVLRASLPPGAADVLGPAPCGVARVKDRWRWHVVVKAADAAVQHAVVLLLARLPRRGAGAETVVDVDPADLT
jgi:primosomal protein N' (replication factor Y)